MSRYFVSYEGDGKITQRFDTDIAWPPQDVPIFELSSKEELLKTYNADWYIVDGKLVEIKDGPEEFKKKKLASLSELTSEYSKKISTPILYKNTLFLTEKYLLDQYREFLSLKQNFPQVVPINDINDNPILLTKTELQELVDLIVSRNLQAFIEFQAKKRELK